jgi:MFS family permease
MKSFEVSRGTAQGTLFAASPEIGPANHRQNQLIFLLSNVLIYFAAPVTYVGVVQAGLCDRLGASATIANLPSSAYLIGYLSPIFLSWLVPKSMDRAVLVISYTLMSTSLLFVSAALMLPFDKTTRIAAVVVQGLVMGLCASAAQVYMLQCLKRGTSEAGIARTFKLTYALGPIAAVAGSLLAQWILGGGIPQLPYPYDYAALYLIGVPCMGGIALLSHYYSLRASDITPPAPPLVRYFKESLALYCAAPALALSALAYVISSFGMETISNLSLYTREALGRDPKEFSGWILALRFGFKCVAGYVLGAIAQRHGLRAGILGTLLFLAAAMLWVWVVPGYPFLFAFALLGAAELLGIYFPGYVLGISSTANSTRNLSILTLVSGLAGLAPAAHGALTDLLGFRASFLFGGLMAVIALLLTLRLPVQIPGAAPIGRVDKHGSQHE